MKRTTVSMPCASAKLFVLAFIALLSRNADGSIINLNGYTEITSAQGTERQFRFALKLLF